MLESKIQEIFNESMQSLVTSADTLGPVLTAACEKLSNTLLSGKRIFTCGESIQQGIADYFSEALTQGVQFERPPFAAISLTSESSNQDALSRQISSLAQPGDLLVVFTSEQSVPSVHAAMTTAISKNMSLIVIFGNEPNADAGLLGVNDIEIRIPSLQPHIIYQQQLMIAQLFCTAIEAQIFHGV